MGKDQDQWFNAAYWIAMRRPFFYKAVVFVALFGNAIIWGIGSLLWWNYLLYGPKYNKMMFNLFEQSINYKDFHQSHIPAPLNITEETALLSSGTKADAIAKISNPNSIWYIPELEYQFAVNGVAGSMEKTWVLPSSERYVASFLVPANIDLKKLDPTRKETMPTAKLVIKDVKWQRFRANPVKMPMFEFKNQSVAGSNFSATIVNKTILSFWNVGVYMVRYGRNQEAFSQSESIVGVKFLQLSELPALRDKDFSIVWENNSPITKTVLAGEVDPYNLDNIIPFDQGGVIQNF